MGYFGWGDGIGKGYCVCWGLGWGRRRIFSKVLERCWGFFERFYFGFFGLLFC